jgi:hypothetical protein
MGRRTNAAKHAARCGMTGRTAESLSSAGRSSAAIACGLLLAGVLSSGAFAQTGAGSAGPGVGAGGMSGGHARSESSDIKPAVPVPDAIPGAKARVPAAPATKPITDMAPSDALFDAINRGDITAARDSLNRGADLDAVNVLGLTPMELSVDLGRNDISFLLLSMRGEDSGRGARSIGRDGPAGSAAPKTVAAAGGHPMQKPTTRARPATAASRPATAPKLFANDGGTALPSAGFLGFDARASSN